MKPMNPQADGNTLIQNQSFFKVLSANVDMGSAATYDSTGRPLTYNQGNGSGLLVRVDAQGVGPAAQHWNAINTDTVIQHTLNRIPIGYIVTYKAAAMDVYNGSLAWTESTITLDTTVNASCVIYIF